jgi:hypothetical protein
MSHWVAAGLLLLVGAVGACKSPQVHRPLALAPESLAQRELETRRFDTADEIRLLRVGLMLLQDEGFQLDEMEADLGVIAASRPYPPFAVSLVSRPVASNPNVISLRVTYHFGLRGAVRLTDATVYREFFSRLSKALSIEGRSL